MTSPSAESGRRPASRHRRRLVVLVGCAIAFIVVVVLLWNRSEQIVDGQSSDASTYLVVIALIFGDAICPVLPGETTLNAATILAANGELALPLVMLSGAIGAIGGDSTLYWISRTARGRVRDWLDHASAGKTGTSVVTMLHRHGSTFIVVGRYVPGLRFALNVALGGVVRMPYPKFLLWSSISGVLWSVWTCLSAYLISSALDGYPILSLVISTVAGTVVLGSLVWVRNHLYPSKSKPAMEAAE